MSKLKLGFLVASGMWTTYCMMAIINTLDFTRDIYYNLGVIALPSIISIPIFVIAYWQFKKKPNAKPIQ